MSHRLLSGIRLTVAIALMAGPQTRVFSEPFILPSAGTALEREKVFAAEALCAGQANFLDRLGERAKIFTFQHATGETKVTLLGTGVLLAGILTHLDFIFHNVMAHGWIYGYGLIAGITLTPVQKYLAEYFRDLWSIARELGVTPSRIDPKVVQRLPKTQLSTVNSYKQELRPLTLEIVEAYRQAYIEFRGIHEAPLPVWSQEVYDMLRTHGISAESLSRYIELVKDSSDHVLLFQSDITNFLGLPADALMRWAERMGKRNAARYLLSEYNLLFNQWVDALVETDLSKPPSPFERHVVSTFLRQMAGNTPWNKVTQDYYRREIDYRGHRFTMKRFLEKMFEIAPADGWMVHQFILQRYGLVESLSLKSFADLKKALESGILKKVHWNELFTVQPGIISSVIEAIGRDAGRPGRGVLWLDQKEHYAQKITVLSSPDRPFTGKGLYDWAVKKLPESTDPNKPKSAIFYLASLAGYEITWDDVRIALREKWIERIPYFLLPDRMLKSMSLSLIHSPSLPRPFFEMAESQFSKIDLPGFSPLAAQGFVHFFRRNYNHGQFPVHALNGAA